MIGHWPVWLTWPRALQTAVSAQLAGYIDYVVSAAAAGHTSSHGPVYEEVHIGRVLNCRPESQVGALWRRSFLGPDKYIFFDCPVCPNCCTQRPDKYFGRSRVRSVVVSLRVVGSHVYCDPICIRKRYFFQDENGTVTSSTYFIYDCRLCVVAMSPDDVSIVEVRGLHSAFYFICWSGQSGRFLVLSGVVRTSDLERSCCDMTGVAH